MDTLAQLAAVSAVLAGAVTVVAAVSLRMSRKDLRDSRQKTDRLDAAVLADPRSCFQETLAVLGFAASRLDRLYLGRDGLLELVHLLRANPHLAFSEVISDRILLSIEQTTSATEIWIVQDDESIEFEYATAAVSFSEAVFDNIRRGVVYRYLVATSSTTRERAPTVMDVVGKDGLSGRLQIRFLPKECWEKLGGKAGGLAVYRSPRGLELFHRFPRVTEDSGQRKWIRVPREEADARMRDLESMWERAQPVSALSNAQHSTTQS